MDLLGRIQLLGPEQLLLLDGLRLLGALDPPGPPLVGVVVPLVAAQAGLVQKRLGAAGAAVREARLLHDSAEVGHNGPVAHLSHGRMVIPLVAAQAGVMHV